MAKATKTGKTADKEMGPRMNEIVEHQELQPSLKLWKLYVPEIARRVKPGQFVVLRGDDRAERIPLTVADFDREKGTITVIFQEVGASTRKLGQFQLHQTVLDVVGPLGKPSHIEKFGTVVCIGGGVGVAPVYPIAKALHQVGNEVISIIGARTKELLILEEEMKAISSKLLVTTDDGTYGHHGFVTDELKRLMAEGTKIDLVVAIGPVVMMRAVTEVTRDKGIKTIVSLNSVMIDGTGMCGGCRTSVGGETKFVCVDGPEFDGHLVNFKELMMRQQMYNREERRALWDHTCRLDEQVKGIRKSKKREKMPEQDPKRRIQNFNEVALGYTRENALKEAARCLGCKNMPCVEGCPVNVQIPVFINKIKEGDFMGAIHTIKETNSLPAICGRVCPQESQCESKCVLGKKGEPVAVGRLERFAADYEFAVGDIRPPEKAPKTGKKVAIVGAGPAGLTVAGELAKKGHEVVIFEALHKAGGVLVYGIPEFRLPKSIVQLEVDYVGKCGASVKTNTIIGQTMGLDELLGEEGFDAAFIGTGAGLPYFLDIPGENLNGVYSANEFLTRANLMKAYLFPEYDTPIRVGNAVAVIGGGNVAMDSARVARRLGAEHVYLIYRRSRAEMPARAEEAHHAEEEGIDFRLLTNPIGIVGDDKGWVTGIKCVQMELGEADASGRRRPVEIKGSEHIIPIDVVIVAIGQGPNPILTSNAKDLELRKSGNIVADPETGKTSQKGVFAGGDIVTGAATVILAMGAGKKAAVAMDEYLKTGKW